MQSESDDSDGSEEGDSSTAALFLDAKPVGHNFDSVRASPGGACERDDGFIVQDDSTAAQLPMEFRNQQDLAYNFKTICQLFVHLAVQPSEERQGFMQEALKGEVDIPIWLHM